MALRNLIETKYDLVSALTELAELSQKAGTASLRERLLSDRLPRLEEERAVLVVLGEFNHGKTTFVNALLGGPVLPTGITPTTAIIHEVRYGEKPAAVLLKRPETAGLDRRALPLGGPREPIAFERLTEMVAGGRLNPDEILRVELDYPAAILRDKVTLVDTPGVNDLNLQRAEITYGYVPRADAVVFLLDAGQILKESERRFLRERLLGAGRDRIVFAINKADLLSDAERVEVIEYARKQLSTLVPGAPVQLLSAARALAGDREGSGLNSLLGQLSALLGNDRLRMLVDYAADEGLRVSDILGRGLGVRRRALTMSSEELARRTAALEADLETARDQVGRRRSKIDEEIAAIKAVAQRDLEAFTAEFAAAVRLEVEKSTAEDVRKFLPGFIEDTWRKWLESEGKALGERLEALAEQTVAIVNEDAREASAKLQEQFGSGTATIDVKVDTIAYDLSVFAVAAFGMGLLATANFLVGGVLTLAAPALSLFFRDRVDKEVKTKALEAAPAAVRQCSARIGPALAATIDRFGQELGDFVANASEELRRSMLEVLASTRQALAEAHTGEAPSAADVDALQARLKALKERLERLRQRVWEQPLEGIAGIPMASA
ncbi:MAG: dynamin family protein [Deltaproteobacteria bacterium]|nr:dynamin family protein [Deltaproteobacteria bacterium]